MASWIDPAHLPPFDALVRDIARVSASSGWTERALGLRAAWIDVADEAAVQRSIDERNEGLPIPPA